MPRPFPGMDPYLEHPALWEDVHTRLIVAIADALGQQVRPTYHVAVERRAYLAIFEPGEHELVGRPDVLVAQAHASSLRPSAVLGGTAVAPRVGELIMPDEVAERYLEVRDVVSGDVITVVELLSPTNKLTREGRSQYTRKRLKILGSATHLVEIDLLRAGEPLPMRVQDGESSPYRIVVSRSQDRPRADVYLFGVCEPIPDVPVPLRAGEREAVLALNQVLHDMFDRAGYDQVIDYQQPPAPPPASEDTVWFTALLQK